MDVRRVCKSIDALINYAIAEELLDKSDRVWARNTLLPLIGLDTYSAPDSAKDASTSPVRQTPPDPEPLLAEICSYAREAGVIEEGHDASDRLSCAIMNVVMPRPSEVTASFSSRLAAGDSKEACRYLYHVSQAGAYVHAAASMRDIKWKTPSTWGDLEITINLSKPEKDPRAIAALAAKPPSANADSAANPKGHNVNAAKIEPDGDSDAELPPYPACQLCLDNEGYAGRLPGNVFGTHPARQNLRIVPIPLDGKGNPPWALQYSPYAYYNEHCIVINPDHTPMHIDETTLKRLLEFVDLIPEYFIGSNADLPIVGGSILNHDHFQAGNHLFPMDEAPLSESFNISGFSQVKAGIVTWPLSVLRLESENRDELLKAAGHILDAWRTYSDPDAGIIAKTSGQRHNTITPIARRIGSVYTLNLALRCNITSAEHPLGVFHPHEHLHHIKKENIGLIEVMGLAILPARLSRELAAVEPLLVELAREVARAGQNETRNDCVAFDKLSDNEQTGKHAPWAYDVAKRHPELTAKNVHEVLQDEVGQVFREVLECAGVFKWDEAGRAAQHRFLDAL